MVRRISDKAGYIPHVTRNMPLASLCCCIIIALGAFCCTPSARAQGFGALIPYMNLSISGSATAHNTGLPKYPGAHRDSTHHGAANILAQLGKSGFKLAAVSLITPDPPQKVAPFYQKALAQYGMVVNCTNHSQDDNALCNDSKNSADFELHAGQKYNQHIATIVHFGTGTKITLLHLWIKGL